MKIKLFVTGGTFDKEYDELEGQLFFKQTHVEEMLNEGRSKLDIEIETLMMIDSLDMTDKDRQKILQACQNAKQDKILITHGTDTMVETSELLARHIKDKTIVLTGAMVPYKFGSSDGMFNIGSALAFVQVLSHGVYIAMNGRHLPSEYVRKNKALGIFEYNI